MGDSRVDCGGFWLPAEFLTQNDILMDKENFTQNGFNPNTEFGLLGSTRSMTRSESEEDDFLAEMNRQFTRSAIRETHKVSYPLPQKPPLPLQKTRVTPVSALTPVAGTRTMHFKAPLPPTSPLGRNYAAWDMVCAAAAGQMNGLKSKNSGPVGPTRIHPPNPNIILYNNNIHHEEWRRGCFAWPPEQVENKQHEVYQQNQRRSGGGAFGGVVRRECAGTGVFLPRRYTAATPVSRRKSAAALPHKAQVARKNFENVMTTQAQPHPQFNGGGVNPEYDFVTAQRDGQLAQQKRNKMMQGEGVAINQETKLPQEWTY